VLTLCTAKFNIEQDIQYRYEGNIMRVRVTTVAVEKQYEVRHTKNETNLIAREPRVGGERQTHGYRTCSDLSQWYKTQLDHFTQNKWTHLQI